MTNNEILYGAAYYDEYMPYDRIKTDMQMMKDAGYQVVETVILPDEKEMLKEKMAKICDENIADLILTTGGTGFAPRDVMPEATKEICQKEVPGIPEAMRAFSMQFTNKIC